MGEVEVMSSGPYGVLHQRSSPMPLVRVEQPRREVVGTKEQRIMLAPSSAAGLDVRRYCRVPGAEQSRAGCGRGGVRESTAADGGWVAHNLRTHHRRNLPGRKMCRDTVPRSSLRLAMRLESELAVALPHLAAAADAGECGHRPLPPSRNRISILL